MAKQRRDPVAEVMGGASPVSSKVHAQMEAARRARREAGMDRDDTPRNEAPPAQTSLPTIEASEPERRVRPKRTKPSRSQSARRARTNSGGSSLVKRVPVSVEEAKVTDSLCRKLSELVDAKVSYTQATRALWAAVAEAEDALSRVEAPQLTRPANGDTLGNAEFEEELTEFLLSAFQQTKRR